MKKIVESNQEILKNVMEYHFTNVLDTKHEKAFKLNLSLNDVKITKKGRKIVLGYFDPHNNLEGLGIKLKVNEDYDKFES